MKAKTPLPPLNIMQSEEPGYASIESLIGENNNSVINQSGKATENLYSVVRIVRDKYDNQNEPITPVTPATPSMLIYAATPINKEALEKFYIRYAQHNKNRPIGPIKCKHAAPEEAPPPIPVESYDGITSTCALSLTGETIYAEPHIGG
ncbi:hypothetical protein A3306_00035 [Rickettsia bellii]|uniref:Uncharacterized protein n=3 Tax=Rickettsia bellii TaxID=33990 RepID=Q1RJB5_RICBR|nr:hypothetical protein [Rickettsia bellii]ABE04549.1 unknown [Rickettsia bellii RML369-C]ARD85704.1 hypothetical protein A3306_00035 [Rickettsia bellii]KJV89325.1 hypothetical protein RBEAN4_0297 [Rickettsia bellii str. RML An4]KJV92109.1 hypothetical protein RBEMOGI_0730 [Rickettsia bellii str. RML Mogi]